MTFMWGFGSTQQQKDLLDKVIAHIAGVEGRSVTSRVAPGLEPWTEELLVLLRTVMAAAVDKGIMGHWQADMVDLAVIQGQDELLEPGEK